MLNTVVSLNVLCCVMCMCVREMYVMLVFRYRSVDKDRDFVYFWLGKYPATFYVYFQIWIKRNSCLLGIIDWNWKWHNEIKLKYVVVMLEIWWDFARCTLLIILYYNLFVIFFRITFDYLASLQFNLIN